MEFGKNGTEMTVHTYFNAVETKGKKCIAVPGAQWAWATGPPHAAVIDTPLTIHDCFISVKTYKNMYIAILGAHWQGPDIGPNLTPRARTPGPRPQAPC